MEQEFWEVPEAIGVDCGSEFVLNFPLSIIHAVSSDNEDWMGLEKRFVVLHYLHMRMGRDYFILKQFFV